MNLAIWVCLILSVAGLPGYWQYQYNFQWASCQIREIAGCACAGNAGNIFPRRRLQRKPIVSAPGMHHGTCVTGSLSSGGGENVPGIPGACATRKFTHLVRSPCSQEYLWKFHPWVLSIMMTSLNGNIFRVNGLLCGELTGHRGTAPFHNNSSPSGEQPEHRKLSHKL